MKKLSLLFLLSLALVAGLRAQQRIQYSQYLLNGFLTNPAVGGAEQYLDVKAGFSQQWAGFEGAPRGFYLSANKGLLGTTIGEKFVPTSLPVRGRAPEAITSRIVESRQSTTATNFHLGVGGSIFNEQTGPISYTGFSAAFSGHVHLSRELRLSVGASVELLNYRLDPTAITFLEANDIAISNSATSLALPSLNAGFALYNRRFFVAGATRQLLQNRIQVNPQNPVISGLEVHYLGQVGYRVPLGYGISLLPSFIVRHINPAPPSWELSLAADIDDFLYFGTSYRHKDAIIGMLGINLSNNLGFSYSYDFTTSQLRNVSSGTHSLVLRLRFLYNDRIGRKYFW